MSVRVKCGDVGCEKCLKGVHLDCDNHPEGKYDECLCNMMELDKEIKEEKEY